MEALVVKNLTFAYSQDRTIIDNISLSINEGEYISIIGPNGSGKSTLARLLVGLLEAKSGEIYIHDEKLSKKTLLNIRKRVGMVFQNPDNQFIGATVEDDIAFGLENQNLKKEDMYKTVIEFSTKVGMISYLHKEPSLLSGGQKQRVALASVLALAPDILVLDEATSMLDPKGRNEVRELINEIKKSNPSLTVLSITHDVEEAANSDRVLVIVDGKVEKFATPNEVFSSSEDLKKCHLSTPFFFELKEKLKKEGIDLEKEKDLYEARELLCPSK